ncbi:MAG: hypothetical protein AABX48_04320 [Nanoarchaeota archaeon]
MKKEALLEYKQKRNFKKTIEPKPIIRKPKGKLKYSIQEHNTL